MKFFDCFSGRRVEGNFGLNFVERRILATSQKAQEPQPDPWACAMPSDGAPDVLLQHYAEEYADLLIPEPATKAGEWIDHDHAPCPIPLATKVEVRMAYDNGATQIKVNNDAGYFASGLGYDDWRGCNVGSDRRGTRWILAYRIVSAAEGESHGR